MNKICDKDGNVQFITNEGKFTKEEIAEIVSTMSVKIVNVDGVNYTIRPELEQ